MINSSSSLFWAWLRYFIVTKVGGGNGRRTRTRREREREKEKKTKTKTKKKKKKRWMSKMKIIDCELWDLIDWNYAKLKILWHLTALSSGYHLAQFMWLLIHPLNSSLDPLFIGPLIFFLLLLHHHHHRRMMLKNVRNKGDEIYSPNNII